MTFVQHRIPTHAGLKFLKGATENPPERQMSQLVPKKRWRNGQIKDTDKVLDIPSMITDLVHNVQKR